ncbi:glycosyl transferase family 2 [Gramella sp. Hel_I_59]|uniref:glycosyltransferase n=1 Tax=Gramella sp. Hel_I_59 TaxID=1249978 RepID=UPI00114FCF71|nr:glycosyltransferase [Gramella sp. Hel_I_59]TQI71555.1 glycosyl transferase family 2 [Gramella sp. Hel_I_59]
MKSEKEIALFIPCYNEEERLNIKAFQLFIKETSVKMDFYFIDDGSLDNTADIISNNLIDKENVQLIKLDRNRGKGNALRVGMLQSLLRNYEFYAFIDADLDVPLDQVCLLHKELIKSSGLIAISKRNLKSNFDIFNLRSIASLCMVNLANRIIGFENKIKDTQCGCKMLHREIVEICFKDEFISEWLFDIEIFLRLKKEVKGARERIFEVKLHILNKNGRSKFRFRQNFKIAHQLYRINKFYN